jgi:hypothetical protein
MIPGIVLGKSDEAIVIFFFFLPPFILSFRLI